MLASRLEGVGAPNCVHYAGLGLRGGQWALPCITARSPSGPWGLAARERLLLVDEWLVGSRVSDSALNSLQGFGGSFVRMSYLYHSWTVVQFTDFYMLNTHHWPSIYASHLLEGICLILTLPTELKRRGATEVNPVLSLQSYWPQCPSRCLCIWGLIQLAS